MKSAKGTLSKQQTAQGLGGNQHPKRAGMPLTLTKTLLVVGIQPPHGYQNLKRVLWKRRLATYLASIGSTHVELQLRGPGFCTIKAKTKRLSLSIWVAVKDLKLSYHNGYM